MGNRTRIRWVNVARLGAAAIGCVALVVGLPALLERPKPPPLPDDIGLAHAAGASPAAVARMAQAPPAAHDPAKRAHVAKPRHASHGERHDSPRPHHHHAPDRDRTPPAPTPVAAPAAAPSPAPAPAPPAPAPSTTYAPPTPAPAVTSSPSPPASSSAGAESAPDGPSEFGFEH